MYIFRIYYIQDKNITKTVATIIATTQYHVVEIFLPLYFPYTDSKMVAINGGIAKGKYPIGSVKNRFEKNANTSILSPVTNEI